MRGDGKGVDLHVDVKDGNHLVLHVTFHDGGRGEFVIADSLQHMGNTTNGVADAVEDVEVVGGSG